MERSTLHVDESKSFHDQINVRVPFALQGTGAGQLWYSRGQPARLVLAERGGSCPRPSLRTSNNSFYPAAQGCIMLGSQPLSRTTCSAWLCQAYMLDGALGARDDVVWRGNGPARQRPLNMPARATCTPPCEDVA